MAVNTLSQKVGGMTCYLGVLDNEYQNHITYGTGNKTGAIIFPGEYILYKGHNNSWQPRASAAPHNTAYLTASYTHFHGGDIKGFTSSVDASEPNVGVVWKWNNKLAVGYSWCGARNGSQKRLYYVQQIYPYSLTGTNNQWDAIGVWQTDSWSSGFPSTGESTNDLYDEVLANTPVYVGIFVRVDHDTHEILKNSAGNYYITLVGYDGTDWYQLASIANNDAYDVIEDDFVARYGTFPEDDWDVKDTEDNTDPYGGSTTTGGGGGTTDLPDAIAIPGLPSVSAVDTGFVNLFNPTSAQLGTLATFMWTSDFYENIIKLWGDPMDAIIGLNLIPVQVPSSGTEILKVGNVSTNIPINKASSQWVQVDCGELTITELIGAYLDYSPYTKIDLYLPYVGMHPLAVDEVMGKTIRVVYNVDILTGACMCFVYDGFKVLYTFSGQCGVNLPISGQNFSQVIQTVVGVAGSIGTMVATGGATAPMVAGSIAAGAGSVVSTKPNIEKSGSCAGTSGLMGIQYPYIIITRPNICDPRGQNDYIGYPTYIPLYGSQCHHYTEFESVHIKSQNAYESEKDEIERMLLDGVYFNW